MATTELILPSGEKIEGVVTVVDSARELFQALGNAKIEDQKREILNGLFMEISRAACTMSELDGIQLVRTASSLCGEISSENPRKMWLNLSLEGLTNMVAKLGERGTHMAAVLTRIKTWYDLD